MNIANDHSDAGYENCFAKHTTWPDINDTMLERVGQLLKHTQEYRVAHNEDAKVATELDLVNLRGYCFGNIAKAVRCLATILESGLRLVTPDAMALGIKGKYKSYCPVNGKYAKNPVQLLARSGCKAARLPIAEEAVCQQEDLTLGRFRQLLYGMQSAATTEADQYKNCLLLLARLVWRNTPHFENDR